MRIVSERELRAWCSARLADFKAPRAFFFVERIPRTPTGKIQRRLLVGSLRRH
jgi:acyl-CoA synthetase (AMP-forming)/AMP-acid ligase II